MLPRIVSILFVVFAVSLLSGCFGQSKATGKYANQDKPKPVDAPSK